MFWVAKIVGSDAFSNLIRGLQKFFWGGQDLVWAYADYFFFIL